MKNIIKKLKFTKNMMLTLLSMLMLFALEAAIFGYDMPVLTLEANMSQAGALLDSTKDVTIEIYNKIFKNS